jgi:hypothetical protein
MRMPSPRCSATTWASSFPGAPVAAVCAAAREQGARYLSGAAYDRASPIGRFYERIAVAFDSAECHCSGAAFQRLADLHGRPPRVIARQLPPKAWNYTESCVRELALGAPASETDHQRRQ